MPPDIRSFFGSKPTAAASSQKEKESNGKKDVTSTGRRKTRKVIEDDSDDEILKEKITTPKKPSQKRKAEASIEEATTSTDYFASSKSSKANQITPDNDKKKKTRSVSEDAPATPSSKGSHAQRSRTSARKAAPKQSYAEGENDTEPSDDFEGLHSTKRAVATTGDRAFVNKKQGNHRGGSVLDQPAKSTPIRSKKTPDEDDKAGAATAPPEHQNGTEKDNAQPRVKQADPAVSKKRKSIDSDDEVFEQVEAPQKQSQKTMSPTKSSAKKPRTSKKNDIPESSNVQAIFDSIATVRAPTPPTKDPDVKFDWRKGGTGGGNAGPPPAAGAKDIPIGEENCLIGLTFVFTGLLDTISRDDAIELVKRYGGRLTTSPSSKTDFVVLGADAGPSKLEKIRKLNIKSINEDGLFDLIRKLPANGGDGKNAEKQMEKKRAEEEKITRDVAEMERQDRERAAAEAKKAAGTANARDGKTPVRPLPSRVSTSQLWTTKYAPTKLQEICGNKGQVLKISNWLTNWSKNRHTKFQKRGADGTGAERAILIHGPPGIGKTTAAHLAARLANFDVIESNASDTRSKKLVESGLSDVLNNNSLNGYFAADGNKLDKTKKQIVLVLDEVDGMSAGDRGGVGALAKLCKKTEIPMILICNERRSPKMKPFDHVTYDVPFKRPSADEIRSRMATIAKREGLDISGKVIDALVEGTHNDIRQVINMLSAAKLDQTAMDFSDGKSMSKAWEKHTILKPWDICHKLLGSGLFAPSSKATLNDKIELYFNDHEFSYLMVQENYLSTRPMLANDAPPGKEQRLKVLELIDQAAESISDGDLVDRMIHGSQQQWSLMPTHAVFSAVKPCSLVSGAMTSRTSFTTWLGNNSKQGKLIRYVKEIQSHMRLRTSGDRHEIRQQYLPVLWTRTVDRLQRSTGQEAVADVIELMDNYFLTREDIDFITELGVGPQDESLLKIPTATKAAFTRIYNQQSHPLPFMKASSSATPAKVARAMPDLEEAMEDEDAAEEAIVEEKDEEDDQIDFKKDKFIAKPKKKPATKKTAGKKGKAGAVAADVKDEEMDEVSDEFEAVPVKKGRGAGKTRGGGARGRGKK